MKIVRLKKDIILFLLLIIFIILQKQIGLFFGYSINFLLYFLIVSSFFINNLELFFLSLSGILFINWKPNLNLEVVLLFLIPQFFYFLLKISKLNYFLNLIIFLVSANFLFYGIINFKLIFNNFNYFFYDTFSGLIFGLLVFYLLKFLGNEK